jgi:hypothetical protein
MRSHKVGNKVFNKDIPPRRAFCAKSAQNTHHYGLPVDTALSRRMKTRTLLEWFATPLIAAATVLWVGVTVYGFTAAFVAQHRMFGLPPDLVLALEETIVWVPLAFLVGIAIGFIVQHSAVYVALASAAATFALFVAMALLGDTWSSSGLEWTQQFTISVSLFATPGLYITIAIGLGARLSAKIRPNSPLNLTRDDARAG